MFDLSVTLTEFFVLLLSSFLGSLLTSSLGVGGGALVLVIMASILPPSVLIPVHGMVQLGSNGFRLWLTKKHVQPSRVVPFLLGALLATIIGLLFIGNMVFKWLPLIVGLFILWLCWGNMPALKIGQTRLGMFIGGVTTTLASVFVGASGPLVAAWLNVNSANRWHYTANFAASMTAQHSVKLIVFGAAGFIFSEWLVLVAAMIFCGYLGTKIGLHMLERIPQGYLKVGFRIVLTLLALRLLWVNYAELVF